MKTASCQPDQTPATSTSRAPVSPGELELPTAEAATKDGDLVTQRDDLGIERRVRSEQVSEDAYEQPQHCGGAFLQDVPTSMIAVRGSGFCEGQPSRAL